MNQQNFYLCPPREALHQAFVGKKLQEAPAPAAVVDRAVVKRNCQRMIDACRDLKVDFRPHTKTHKVKFHSSLCARGEIVGELFIWKYGYFHGSLIE